MAHKEQIEYCKYVKSIYPEYFVNKKVLDVGSLDINGNNRFLFKDCDYTGLDLCAGRNVDIVMPVHKFKGKNIYDVVICTEILEHDKYYKRSLKMMFKLLKSGGLLIITAATDGREEHGVYNNKPEDSPLTNDYYKNITKDMLLKGLGITLTNFTTYSINVYKTDIRFFGIKV